MDEYHDGSSKDKLYFSRNRLYFLFILCFTGKLFDICLLTNHALKTKRVK